MVHVMDDKKRIYLGIVPHKCLSIDDAQIAILSWIYGKYNHSELIFCIEDIHSQYSSELHINHLINNLKWLGIDYHKTGDEKNSQIQFRQSKRLSIYQDIAKQLVQTGKAYPCYCKPKSNGKQTRNQDFTHYTWGCDGKCRRLSIEQRYNLEKQGLRPRVYLRVDIDEYEIDDLIQGKISFAKEALKDFVILHGNGKPTTNFAVAVDMYDLNIAFRFQHNKRRNDSLEQIFVIEALGEPFVKFAHFSDIEEVSYVHLQNYDLRRSIDYYREQGYLSEALVKWLATLDLPDEIETIHFNLEKLIANFTFNRKTDNLLNIDQNRLDWINQQCMRNGNLEAIVKLATVFLKKNNVPLNDMDKIRKIVELLSKHEVNLAKLARDAELFFKDEIFIQDSQLRAIVRRDNSQKIFWSFLRKLKNIEKLTADAFLKIMQSVQRETGILGKELWLPIRITLTGRAMECELPVFAELLGKAKCEKFVTDIVQNYRY